jgi:putative flippase GtrA
VRYAYKVAILFEKYKQLARRHGAGALVRLVLVSAVQNGFFYLLALGELQIGFEGWQTFALNYPLAVGISFLSNRTWVFAGRDRPKGQFVRYLTVYVVAYIGSMVCAAGLEALGISPALAVFFTMFPNAIGLFLALNLWVFPQGRSDLLPTVATGKGEAN